MCSPRLTAAMSWCVPCLRSPCALRLTLAPRAAPVPPVVEGSPRLVRLVPLPLRLLSLPLPRPIPTQLTRRPVPRTLRRALQVRSPRPVAQQGDRDPRPVRAQPQRARPASGRRAAQRGREGGAQVLAPGSVPACVPPLLLLGLRDSVRELTLVSLLPRSRNVPRRDQVVRPCFSADALLMRAS